MQADQVRILFSLSFGCGFFEGGSVLVIYASKEIVPDVCVESEIGVYLLMVLSMKSAGCKFTYYRDFEPIGRKWFHSNVSQGTECGIEQKIYYNAQPASLVDAQDDQPQGAEAKNFKGA